jgi:hypothetical protein
MMGHDLCARCTHCGLCHVPMPCAWTWQSKLHSVHGIRHGSGGKAMPKVVILGLGLCRPPCVRQAEAVTPKHAASHCTSAYTRWCGCLEAMGRHTLTSTPSLERTWAFWECDPLGGGHSLAPQRRHTSKQPFPSVHLLRCLCVMGCAMGVWHIRICELPLGLYFLVCHAAQTCIWLAE